MTIKELSTLTGLTSSYISQVERNLIIPSLKSLTKIGEALRVPVISLFSVGVTEKGPVTQLGQRKHIKLPNSHIEYELLSPSFNYNVEFLLLTINPDQKKDEELVTHYGEECIYILNGTMKIELGDESYILNPGDSIHFYATISHRLLNVGKDIVMAVVAESPPSF